MRPEILIIGSNLKKQRVRAYFTHWIPRSFGASRCRLIAIYTGDRRDKLFKNAEVIWGIRV